MKKNILIINLLISLFAGLLHNTNLAQVNLQWVKSMGGKAIDNGLSIAVDGSGNVYTTGLFKDTVDFDPGTGITNLTSVGSGGVFISKLDAFGNFVWAKNAGAGGRSIAVDGIGNVFSTGGFGGIVDFDPGAGIANLTSAGNYDIFISKLDASGNFVWAKSMGGMGDDQAYSIAVDGSGNVCITGSFEGTVDFDPGAGTANLTSAGASDIFISKLDASGNFVWAKSMGGTGINTGYSIVVDGSGNIYTTGHFYGTTDFDPGAGTANLTSAGSGSGDIFISKLDAFGNFMWGKSMGGIFSDRSFSIAVDGSGNVYTTGYFNGTADFDPGVGIVNLIPVGSYDIFISKLDALGNFLWAKSIGGTNADYVRSMVVDGIGNVYTTGSFQLTTDFDPGAGIVNLNSAGGQDIFINKLDTSGNLVWAISMGGYSQEIGHSIALDSFGNVYSTGSFGGIADFNPGAGIANLTSAGQSDIFVHKMSQTGVGVQEFNNTAGTTLYPNPVKDILTIAFASENEEHTYELYDITGRVLFKNTTSNNKAQLSLAHLSKGVYILRVAETTFKIIKD